MAKIAVKIVTVADKPSQQINRQFFKKSEMVIVTNASGAVQPLPITQAEYDASQA